RLGRATERQVVRLARVAVGDAHVLPRAKIVALIQLVRSELYVRLGDGQLARRALVRAAIARLLRDRAHLAHVRLELHARAPASADHGQHGNDGQQAHSGERTRPNLQTVGVHSGSDRFGAAGSSRSVAGVTRVDLLAALALLVTAIARARFARSSAFFPYSIASWYSAYPPSSRALCKY